MTHTRNVAANMAANMALLLLVVILLIACSTENPASVAAEPTAVLTSTDAPTPTGLPNPTNTPVPRPEPDPTATPEPEPTPTPEVDPEPEAEEQTVVERVITTFPKPAQTNGHVVLLYGYVLDANGDPIPHAAVEIWQTDGDGFYDHPRDPSTESRDTSFQFFGTSEADDVGLYSFRTISPGYYESRPKHIHVKVKIDGSVALITQFYFDEDRAELASEGLFAEAGDQGERLILETVESFKADDNTVTVLTNDLVIDTGGGSLMPTPAQGEGPYYPVVNVSEYDNDLTIFP